MAKKTFKSKVNTERKELADFDIFEETFYIKPALPTSFYIDLMATLAEMQETKNSTAFVRELKPFFRKSLVAESAKRFEKILDSEDKIIDIETLIEIFDYIISETANRPTSGSAK